MKFNGKNIKIESIKIFNSYAFIKNIKTHTNEIKISSKNEELTIQIYTLVPHLGFNSLKLNTKTNIIDKIDSSDIALKTKDNIYFCNKEKSRVFFTKLAENIFRLNLEINDEEKNINFELETIIDFNKIID